MASVKPFVLSSFQGGLNVYDPPHLIQEDQVTEAINVEFHGAAMGQKRLGCAAIDLPASVLAEHGVYKMHRHMSNDDESVAELWMLIGTNTSSASLAYMDGSHVWDTEALVDTPNTQSYYLARANFLSLHGKLFIAYKSSVDRLHVWDGNTLRTVGIAQPDPPTAADGGPPGDFGGYRYYRVRYTEMSGSTVIRRSEPSTSLKFAPNGVQTEALVTQPASPPNEGETHWELEASLDNANFYKIATDVIATPTVTDTTPYASGYAIDPAGFPLSEPIGAYTVIPSGRFLVVDNDRLVMGGSFTNADEGSKISWTPVALAPGVGNDERFDSTTDPFLNLDGQLDGEITGMVGLNGVIYVFKRSRTYRLTRSGLVNAAYDADLISPTIGAMWGSVVVGADPLGNPAVFFADKNVGPCMIGTGGLTKLGRDIRPYWERRTAIPTLNAIKCVYYAKYRQVIWYLAIDGSIGTNIALVLHLDEVRFTSEGGTRGWTVFTGAPMNDVSDVVLYAPDIDSGTALSDDLVPFISKVAAAYTEDIPNCVVVTQQGDTDMGTSFTGSIVSRPIMLGAGSIKFGIREASLMATAVNTTLTFSIIRDFGLETNPVNISIAPEASETHVMRSMDNSRMSEAKAITVRVADYVHDDASWELQQIVLTPRSEEGP